MRAHPPARAAAAEEKRLRWEAIAAAVPGRTVKDVVARCRVLREAVRKVLPPPLLRLDADLQLLILERVGGAALCAIACACKELVGIATTRSGCPSPTPSRQVGVSKRDRGDERRGHTLRMRDGPMARERSSTTMRPACAPIWRRSARWYAANSGRRMVRWTTVSRTEPSELVQLQAKRMTASRIAHTRQSPRRSWRSPPTHDPPSPTCT